MDDQTPHIMDNPPTPISADLATQTTPATWPTQDLSGEDPAASAFAYVGNLLKRRFLTAFSRCGQIGRAAQIAGCTPDVHYRWKADPEYLKAFNAAWEMAGDMIEGTAVHRAVEGVEEGVYWRGERVASERKYSDVLLAQQLNGRFPERYKYSRMDANISIRALHIVIRGDEDLPGGI